MNHRLVSLDLHEPMSSEITVRLFTRLRTQQCDAILAFELLILCVMLKENGHHVNIACCICRFTTLVQTEISQQCLDRFPKVSVNDPWSTEHEWLSDFSSNTTIRFSINVTDFNALTMSSCVLRMIWNHCHWVLLWGQHLSLSNTLFKAKYLQTSSVHKLAS